MKVKMKNFRCHENYEVDLPNEGVVLLSGASGCGKTTILNALAYALYGRLVKPYTHDRKECSVEVKDFRIPTSTESIDVERTSPGARLKVRARGELYEDEGAQGVIDGLVGGYEKFVISSYVVQRLDCSLVSLPPREQVDFIKTLASVGDFEGLFRARVKDKVNEFRDTQRTAQAQHQILTRRLGTRPKTEAPRPTTGDPPKSPRSCRNHIAAKENELGEHQAQTLQLERDYQKQLKLVVSAHARTTATDALAVLKARYAELEHSQPNEGAGSLGEEKRFLLQCVLFLDKVAQVARLRLDLTQLEGKRKAALSSQVLSAQEKEKRQKDGAKCREDYEREAHKADTVAAAKGVVKQVAVETEQRWNPKPKLRKGPAALLKFLEKQKDRTDKAVTGKQGELDALAAQSSPLVPCPVCATPLRLEDGKLVVPEPNPPTPSEKEAPPLDVVQAEYAQLQLAARDVAELVTRLKVALEASAAKVLPKAKLLLLKKKADKLDKSLLLSDASESQLRSFRASADLLASRQQEVDAFLQPEDRRKYERRSASSESLQQALETVDARIAEEARWTDRRDRLKEEITAAAERLGSAESGAPVADVLAEAARIETELTQQRLRTPEILKDLQAAQSALAYRLELQAYERQLEERAALEEEQRDAATQLERVERRLLGFEGLDTLCKKADILATDSTIDEINDHASLYTDQLFSDQIRLRLCRTRTTVKGHKRDIMNTTVSYKGSEYSSLDQLSGGERQRCNLSFILAVNDIIGSPILLLDECLNNLDGETHAEILSFLRRVCQGKLILVVAHEAPVALFDHVVSVP